MAAFYQILQEFTFSLSDLSTSRFFSLSNSSTNKLLYPGPSAPGVMAKSETLISIETLPI